MRIKIKLQSVSEKLSIPQHYNHIIQAVIYRNLNQTLAQKIHNQGYAYEKRQFRFFNYSRLYGSFLRKDNYLVYQDEITLWVSSPITEILESFASHLVKKGKIKIGDSYCKIASIEVPVSEELTDKITIRTLSPITVYSTLKTLDAQKKTYYYSPFEPDFSRLIHQNLLKKYYIINKESFDPTIEFSFIPIKLSKNNEHIVYYKDTVVKAWSGIYQLNSASELIKVGFDCGIGAKNSQGFGMIERYQKRVGVI